MGSIKDPYFLSVAAPTVLDSKGGRWCNELWAKDLALHLNYIDNLTLASPCECREPTEFDTPLDRAPFDRVKYIDLPNPKSHWEALVKLPQLIAKTWQGVRDCRIVHTGFGGWPVSEGWLAVPMAKMTGRLVITNVESSFWRTNSEASSMHRMRGAIIERINRFCVRIADVRLFTSRSYAEQFLGDSTDRAYVVPATWIDAEAIVDADDALSSWASKLGRIRLLFASRLITDKGAAVLAEALRMVANQRKSSLEVVIIGRGELWQMCSDVAHETEGSPIQVSLLEPVSYGKPFLELLRKFDAVLVPSLSDEQPRLIFDAFSQAVPVLGSSTGGICQVVRHHQNGVLFKPADASALAATLNWASVNRPALRAMGINALSDCLQFTHRAMHETREKILQKELVRSDN